MKKNVPLIITVSIAVIAIVLTAGYTKHKKANGFKKGGPGKAGGWGNQSIISVRTTEAKRETLHDYVNTNGEIMSQNEVDVFADIGGKVVSVAVSLGSNVRKGQLLMEIDPSEPGARFAHSPVYSPISGTVTSTPKKTGTKVSTSTAVTTIGDVNNLQISANIPERFVSALKKGLKAEIRLESYPDTFFEAEVTKVSPVLDAASRTKEVILNFVHPDDRINAGMFAKVKLYTLKYDGAVVVPQTSIIDKNGKDCVYIYDPASETVRLVQVEKGKAVDNMIQITRGIEEGQKIVTEGMTVLTDGAKVHEIGSGYNK